MSTLAVVQARLGSTRLPGKVLFELAGKPMIVFLLERAARAVTVDRVVLATGDGIQNDALAHVVSEAGFEVVRGPEDDVLERYVLAARMFNATKVVRLTGDCPLLDSEVVDMVARACQKCGVDYATNVIPATWPDGLDVSVFTRDILEAAHAEAHLPSEREHVVPWMWKNTPLEGGNRFTSVNVAAPEDYSAHRWTVDEADDFLFLRKIVAILGTRALSAGWHEVLDIATNHFGLSKFNKHIIRDAGYLESLRKEAFKDE